MERFDVAIVGAGIAGASLAFALAGKRRVVLLEQESQPGYHSTGRSAALYTEHYGNATVRALTRASGRFLKAPPAGFAEHPILSRRRMLFIARPEQMSRLDAAAEEMRAGGGTPRRLDWSEARSLVPILAPGYGAGALLDPEAMDIDVHALLQDYLRAFRSAGGALPPPERRNDTARIAMRGALGVVPDMRRQEQGEGGAAGGRTWRSCAAFAEGMCGYWEPIRVLTFRRETLAP